MKIHRGTGIPLYVQIRERLREELAQLEPGTAIPTEPELESRFGVSRITVRKAIDELVSDGLLVRQQGRGTFLQKQKLVHELNTITSWTEQLRTLGFTPRTSQKKIKEIGATKHVSEMLRLAPDDPVVMLQRLRLADKEPVSLMINYLPSRLVPGFVAKPALTESLYETLEKRYGLVPALSVDTVDTRAATDEEAEQLKIDSWAPVLCVQRLSYLEDGTPLELAIVTSRGDRYQYQVTLRGRARAGGASTLSSDLYAMLKGDVD